MSGVWPLDVGFQSVSTSKRHYNLSSESINGRVQVRSLGASRREFTISYPPMTQAEFKPILDFMDLQEGMLGTFTIDIPDASTGIAETVTCRLASDTAQAYSVGVGNLYEFEVDLIEVV